MHIIYILKQIIVYAGTHSLALIGIAEGQSSVCQEGGMRIGLIQDQ